MHTGKLEIGLQQASTWNRQNFRLDDNDILINKRTHRTS